MEQRCEFRGKHYKFIGDPTIECKCLSNGHRCNQRSMLPAPSDCFMGRMDSDGFLCSLIWKEIKKNEIPNGFEFWSETDAETLLRQCYSIGGKVPFLEEYSHTNCVHWKILNTFTQFREDKRVLGTIDEGIVHSLKMAIPLLYKAKLEYFGMR